MREGTRMGMRAGGLRVAGLISGTSMDGIHVAIVRIRGAGSRTRMRLETFRTVPYPARVRRALLASCNAKQIPVAEISQLNFLVGELFSRAVEKTCAKARIPLRSLDLIGSHGQTIYHHGRAGNAHGFRVASTLQIGEPAIIAERIGVPTVADFRTADMAAGGTGAPLAPFLDYLLYRHPQRGRAALNIGGIANVTLIPPGAAPADVVALDTGPGNMVLNALVEHFTGGRRHFDRDGQVAARGRVRQALLRRLLRHPFFRQPAPRTAGREEFGREVCGHAAPREAVARKPAGHCHGAHRRLHRRCDPTLSPRTHQRPRGLRRGCPQSISHGAAGGRAAHPNLSR